MKIRKLDNTDQQALEAFLHQYVESSLFLLSNCRQAGLEFHNEPYQGDYFAAFSGQGEITGVLAHFWNGNIMVQAPEVEVLLQLAAVFQQQATRPIAGIVSDAVQAETLVKALRLVDAEYQFNTDDGLYSLALDSLCRPSDLKASGLVPVDKSHTSLLLQWLRDYNIEALQAEDNEALAQRVTKTIGHMIHQGDGWVLDVAGQPVSLCGFNARLPEIVQIGPVWTPPEHRNQGYARLAVAQALQVARDEGVQRSILFTDNPAAAKAYEAIGFRKIGYFRLAALKAEVMLCLS